MTPNAKKGIETQLIWATRGFSWGFRFLSNAGFEDPLPEYEKVFASVGDEVESCKRVGKRVALRFPDPLARKDAAGRVIPHDFVVLGPLGRQIKSVEDGIRLVWRPYAAAIYAEVWKLPDSSVVEKLN